MEKIYTAHPGLLARLDEVAPRLAEDPQFLDLAKETIGHMYHGEPQPAVQVIETGTDRRVFRFLDKNLVIKLPRNMPYREEDPLGMQYLRRQIVGINTAKHRENKTPSFTGIISWQNQNWGRSYGIFAEDVSQGGLYRLEDLFEPAKREFVRRFQGETAVDEVFVDANQSGVPNTRVEQAIFAEYLKPERVIDLGNI